MVFSNFSWSRCLETIWAFFEKTADWCSFNVNKTVFQERCSLKFHQIASMIWFFTKHVAIQLFCKKCIKSKNHHFQFNHMNLQPLDPNIDLAHLLSLSTTASEVLEHARTTMLAPSSQKNHPVFSTLELAELCGVEKTKILYAAKKGH